MSLHSLAGKRVPASAPVDVLRLVATHYSVAPDMAYRGSSLAASFDETHSLAVTQAVCERRAERRITGLLFLGWTPRPCQSLHGAACWKCWPRMRWK